MSLVEVTVAMTVRDVLSVVERRYGSVAKLRAHIQKHPKDMDAVMLHDTVARHAEEPDLVVHLGEAFFGDPADILAFAKLRLIGHVLGHPGVGIRELARGLQKDPATVLEQVEQLEEAGLIRKESHGPGKPAAIQPLIQELNIRVTRAASA